VALKKTLLLATVAALVASAVAAGSVYACDKQDSQATAASAKAGCPKGDAATAKDAPCAGHAAMTASAKTAEPAAKTAKVVPADGKGCAKKAATATAQKKADETQKKSDTAEIAQAR
jgi:hypothetical protein